MINLRSVIYQMLFHLWTVALSIVSLPSLVLPASVIWYISRIWSVTNFAILRWVVGLGYRIEGQENIATEPVIYASKHQSAWDTMIFPVIIKKPVIVLKKELQWIPLYGWYLRKYGCISVDRNAGASALRSMVQGARNAISDGRSIVVFPEGTRTAPGERGSYQSGVAALYRELAIPVVPVALNSGLFWRRRSYQRKPGTIVLRLLPAIQPGLDRKEFMTHLETKIEAAQVQLTDKSAQN